jgi:hypothetical protein
LKIQKIKKFLSAASMGLKAATEWSGYPEDFGGMLLVKKDGDVLFYYLYNMKKFEEKSKDGKNKKSKGSDK